MTSTSNIFNNLYDSISPALNQGLQFKGYQNKFFNNVDKNGEIFREGFDSGTYLILGVKPDGKLYSKESFDSNWVKVNDDSSDLLAVFTGSDGKIYAYKKSDAKSISMQLKLIPYSGAGGMMIITKYYEKPTWDAPNWQESITNVQEMKQFPNENFTLFVGKTIFNQLWGKDSRIENLWGTYGNFPFSIPPGSNDIAYGFTSSKSFFSISKEYDGNPGKGFDDLTNYVKNIKYLTIRPDGSMIGLGTDNKFYTHPSYKELKTKSWSGPFGNADDVTFITTFDKTSYIGGDATSVNYNSNTNEQDIPEENPLATQSREIVEEYDYSGKQEEIQSLREEYDEVLAQYEDLMAKINWSANSYLDRVNNNPYLGKNIRFSSGEVAYVTQQGVIKLIPTNIWNSIAGKNGCPDKTFVDVNMPWLPEYDTLSTNIDELNLITGSPMISGQSCGNAGQNVYVNRLVSNPTEKYIGCYNDKPPSTEILFVPKMNSSNNVSGFISYATSVYQNNNGFCGPWAAFDRSTTTYWHSATNNLYDKKKGEYLGSNSKFVKLKDGSDSAIKGEYLQINLPKKYALTKYELQGRQDCCGNPSGRSPNSWMVVGWDGSKWNEVDTRNNQGLNFEMRTYYINVIKNYNSYVIIITNCGNPGNKTNDRYCVQIAQWNLYTSSDYGFTDSQRAMNTINMGYVDLETCKKYASDNGYKYFGFGNAQLQPDGRSFCSISNDLTSAQQYYTAYNYKQIPLWSSKTNGGTGNTALLSGQGSLVVQNSSNAAIFATPAKKATNYIGCYVDKKDRAMNGSLGGGEQAYNYQTCQDAAIKVGYPYFALQNSTSGQNAQCFLSKDYSSVIKYGVSTNCTRLKDGTYSGGVLSNAVYSYGVDGNYYLRLYNDGNMAIHRGTGPTNSQGLIWESGTRVKVKKYNPNFTAAKSKFGRNWIPSGTTLAAGDFIGSDNGAIYLLMQTDGNLVLYTSETTSACSTNSKGQQVGGNSWVNALYNILPAGFKENIGKLGFVDENNVLIEYPSNNIKQTNNYTKFLRTNTPGNDIPGASYGNATLDQCYSSCNNNKDCYGFVFDDQNKVCWPKTSGMWPYGGTSNYSSTITTYVRGKEPIAVPNGSTKDVKYVDSVQYQMYVDGDKFQNKYGLPNATSEEQQQLTNLQSRMQTLSSRIATLTDEYNAGTEASQTQSGDNLDGLNEYQTDINANNEQSNALAASVTEGFRLNNSINKVLQESDIVVLQKNYEYLLWSILAAGSVIVAMNITKSTS